MHTLLVAEENFELDDRKGHFFFSPSSFFLAFYLFVGDVRGLGCECLQALFWSLSFFFVVRWLIGHVGIDWEKWIREGLRRWCFLLGERERSQGYKVDMRGKAGGVLWMG